MERRKFFRQTLIASGGLVLAPLYVSCSDDETINNSEDQITDNLPATDVSMFKVQNFTEGVASFDPIATSVIIWTRFSGLNASTMVKWQVATDIDFDNLVREGENLVQESFDYTLNIDVQDLPSNSKFYYRFYEESTESVSVIGETITLPKQEEAVSKMKLAVASCSNYAAGFFNVYDAMAKSSADVIVHLGDYIYEYESGGFGTNSNGVNTAALGREHKPDREVVSLEDYRTRYKQYRSDESLQLAHQKKPFIAVWDDHEITNDAFSDGAENHQESEGDFQTRKATAIQVYSEFIPVRTSDPSLIYRSFDFGNLFSLHMLDTRITGRDKQLAFSDFFNADGSFNFPGFGAALADPDRKMLGNTQLNWLSNKLNNNSTWQVLGQQVLMARMFIPAELLINLGASPEVLQSTISELTAIKLRLQANDPSLTPQDIGRVTTVAPYNLDAWDGYAAEREQLLSLFSAKKVINLAGDTHNAWFSDIKNASGEKVATEIATPSVSSPGFEEFLNLTTPEATAGFELALQTLIDDLIYTNSSQRGFLEVEFTASAVTAKWNFINNLASKAYVVNTGKTEVIS